MVSVTYTGIHTNRASNKIIPLAEFHALEALAEEGSFNFTGDPDNFRFFAEAERISSAFRFDPLFAVNCSIVDPLPHQVEAVYKFLLPMPQIRFLLADDTGAGKTIMTGLLLKELMMRGLIERILIITPGGLTRQWQDDEMGIKFNIPFTLVNRSIFNSDPTVFHTAKRIITSIDFISRDEILNVVGNTHWDFVVIDESHKLSAYDYGNKQYLSRRYKAAQILAKQSEHLLLLTATPHRGRQDTFTRLLQLLDEDIFATGELASARVRELGQNGLNKFFIRRLKEDMKDWKGEALYKARFTRTVAFELTPDEKRLYDAVTQYLSTKKEEASASKNIHVSLALTVMQRRLTSSIVAVKNTLQRRWNALQSLVDEIGKNPSLWTQRHKLETLDVDSLDEYDELDDEERDSLDSILSDPRKFKLFTTAKSLQELQKEAADVKKLFDMASELAIREQEEKKFQELQVLLKSEGVLDNHEKLVIFTEHKDTLLYLEERLSKKFGYGVATIHGGKNVEERRTAQYAFAKPDTQILIATDAAGEGINLQFCRLLINWDIPWNPNRLEQRMGRIHRYGQKKDVLVFNMVANNTREGRVLEKLLTKLDVIRAGIGDDRVYDVIQDVFENVSLDAMMKSVFDGKHTELNDLLEQDNATLQAKFKDKIEEQRHTPAHSTINYRDAHTLKEHSDEKRLQPIYIRLFFEKVFARLGGVFTELRPGIYRIETLPDMLAQTLRKEYNIAAADALRSILFCFDKQVFLQSQAAGDLGKVHYISPGNAVFDSLVSVARTQYRDDMLKGTVLVSPEDTEEYFAFFVKSQIIDNRIPSGTDRNASESIADEHLVMVRASLTASTAESAAPRSDEAPVPFSITSPAKFLDLKSPVDFAKPFTLPPALQNEAVVEWTFTNITLPQLHETEKRIRDDADKRREYLETAFTHVNLDIQSTMAALQTKVLLGDTRAQEQYIKAETRLAELAHKKSERLRNLEQMTELSAKLPETLGCAYVVPLTQIEYKGHFGMSRDDDAEAAAMQTAMDYERSAEWTPTDVSANNEGYDIRSRSPEGLKRYIEVKGRSGADGSVMLSENEWNRLAQLGDSAWLYIVTNCKTAPELFRISNPANRLKFELATKGVQYFLPMQAWKQEASANNTETPLSAL